MNPITHYRAVFFDAGDTLLNVPAAQEIVLRFLAMRDVHPDAEVLASALRASIDSMYYGKTKDAEALCSPESDRGFWVALYRFMMERIGLLGSFDEDDIHRWCHELYDVFTSPEPYRLFEDVRTVLPRLRDMGLKLAVISNFAPTLSDIMKVRGMDLSLLEDIVISTEVGLEKPNPEIFRLALERTGLRPEEVLYVGDHEINDVWAPNEIGIDAVRIKRYDYMQGEGIHSLEELLAPEIPWIRKGKRNR